MVADAAIMHPSRNVIALRGNSLLQVFDLGSRQRISTYNLPEGQIVSYWRWADDDTILFVSGPNVFTWSVSTGSAPIVVCGLQGPLSSGAIMNCIVSIDQMWYAIFGVVKENEQSAGKVQMYSREKNASHVADAYTCCFAQVAGLLLIVFASKAPGSLRAQITPLSTTPQAAQFGRRYIDLPIPPDGADDVPLLSVFSPKYNSVFLFTRLGYFYVFEVTTPFLYLSGRNSNVPFIHASLTNDGSVIALTRDGRLIKFSINDQVIVDYISTKYGNAQVAQIIASSAGLQVSNEVLTTQFERLLSQGLFQDAARIAIQNPSLRTANTIRRIQSITNYSGPNPFLQFISTILETDKLNEIESTEICKLVLTQGKNNLIETWITQDRLTLTEDLGDACKPFDQRIALGIYIRANASLKIVACLAEMGQFDKLQQFCQKMNYQPNWMQVLTVTLKTNPDAASQYVQHIANGGHPLVEPKPVVMLLLQFQAIKAAISFLIDILVDDREQDSDLQTLLLETALNNVPQMAEELFARNCFTYYDRAKIAGLCERASNFQRALEHYTDLPSIKRCIVHSTYIQQDFLINYFKTMSTDWALDCLQELLVNNPKQNVQIVVAITGVYYQQFGIDQILALFNKTQCSDGIYYFLASIVPTCTDPDIHFRYIESAAKKGNFGEVERMCTESQYLQPERVRDFLKQADLQDQVPLIVLCDRFGFIDDLTKHLYKKGSIRELETYVQKFNPQNAGKVVGSLIDIEAPIEYIQKLIQTVEHTAPIDELVLETMKRERLKLLQPLLEKRIQAGAEDVPTNNGIVLLAVISNKNPEKVLQSNNFYNPKFVGDILSKRDAHLAYVAYSKGGCDQEILTLTNTHQLYKEQARYCVSRADPGLWATVLNPNNEHMQLVVDSVISTALPECHDPDKVTATVKAFIDAQIPNQLIGLLEKIVLESPDFQNNGSLQNLLIITAIRSDTPKVMNYLNRLENYDWEKICQHLIKEQLFDEAIAAYKKFEQNLEAVRVMIDHKQDIPSAADWAAHCNDPHVWSLLAKAQLNSGYVSDAISSYLKAKDTRAYLEVIDKAKSSGEFKALVPYLKLARELQNTDSIIESELCFAYAKCDMLAELEELVSGPNGAKISEIGERCLSEKLYKAAKILFISIKDYSRLAEVLIYLGDLQGAIEAARKASNIRSWKVVLQACVEAGEFKLAQVAGLQVVIEADQLEFVVSLYEKFGYFNELISLLETALPLERAHIGIFTELAVAYAKYQAPKTFDHLRQYHQKLNLFKVISQLKKMHMWKELTFAYEKYNEFDNAVIVMIEHPSSWTHNGFKDMISQVQNADIIFRSFDFYLIYDPLDMNELLSIVGPKVDTTRVVTKFSRSSHLPLIKQYLGSVQGGNVKAVNEALNELHVEDGDYESLRTSVDRYNLFDHISLAQKLRNHECLEFRRISAYLYRKQGRFQESVEISKKDRFYKDAIETASQSRSSELVEELLRFFISEKLFEKFAAVTYVCYDLVQSDQILELSWRNECTDFAMPYIIQNMKENNLKISKLTSDLNDLSNKLQETKEVAQQVAAAVPSAGGYVPSSDPFAGGGAGFRDSQTGFVGPTVGVQPPFADQFGMQPPSSGFPAFPSGPF